MLQTCLDMRLCDFGTVPHLPKAERCLGGDGGGGDPLSTDTRLNKARHRLTGQRESPTDYKFRKAVPKWERECPADTQGSTAEG